MNVNKELLPEQMVKLTIEVEAEKFNDALNRIYLENRGKCPVEGYATGEAPMEIIEEKYGADIFYRETANLVMSEVIMDAYEQAGVLPGSRPAVNVIQMGKNKPYIFEITFAMVPEVKLAEYKGLTYEKPVIEITDEDIAERIAELQEQNARVITIEDRAVKDGDIVVIDYIGFADGERFKGGSADDYPLEIGSHSFIDTFEEQIIGMNKGDKKDIEVTFPVRYHAPELAGKPATFRVTLKSIHEKIVPELDDEFAKDVSDFETLKEFVDDLKNQLAAEQAEEIEANLEDELVAAVVEASEVSIPKQMVDMEIDREVATFAKQCEAQGLTLEQYLTYIEGDMDGFREQVRPNAERNLKTRLVLDAIGEKEQIEVTDEEINEQVKILAETYNVDEASIAEGLSRSALGADVRAVKAAALIKACAVEA